MPARLAAHLEAHCAIPVLYASSWLLTAFAADFPLFFSSRIMDVVLTDRYLEPMMKARRCASKPLNSESLGPPGGPLRSPGALRVVLAADRVRGRLPALLQLARHGRRADRPIPGAHDEGAPRTLTPSNPRFKS